MKLELREKLQKARDTADSSDMTRVFSARPVSHRVEEPATAMPTVAGARTDHGLSKAKRAATDSDATVWLFSNEARDGAELQASENPGLFLGSIFEDVAECFRSLAARIEGRHVGTDEAVRILLERTVLSDAMNTIFLELRGARNIAVHSVGEDLTPAEAADWAGLALGLRQRAEQRAFMLGLLGDDAARNGARGS